ncbi:unnamed protein product [Rhizophagus irregularis]|uniref:Uncharacterized protein n=1 Tax=Rhizophagus irregularis TaxID=588596 RepID=A0A915ZH73_9GLOM|nr:unnamed protein product [Rhizophagus irregularis]
MKVTRCIIAARILKYTYGIKVRNYWLEGDPIERKIRDGRVDRFHCIAKRGIQVNANEEFTTFFTPLSPMQTRCLISAIYSKIVGSFCIIKKADIHM